MDRQDINSNVDNNPTHDAHLPCRVREKHTEKAVGSFGIKLVS